MEKQKHFYDNLMEQVGTQLHKVNLDGVLGAIGLQRAKPGRGASLPIVAAFGAGMAVGAGAALLLAPTSGKDLRGKLGDLLKKIPLLGGDRATELAEIPDVPADAADDAKVVASKSAKSDGATA